jgi:hypothetical protein
MDIVRDVDDEQVRLKRHGIARNGIVMSIEICVNLCFLLIVVFWSNKCVLVLLENIRTIVDAKFKNSSSFWREHAVGELSEE